MSPSKHLIKKSLFVFWAGLGLSVKTYVYNRRSRCLLTDAGVPPEHVPVEDVEGEVSEAAGDLTVEVLPIERTEGERRHEVNCD